MSSIVHTSQACFLADSLFTDCTSIFLKHCNRTVRDKSLMFCSCKWSSTASSWSSCCCVEELPFYFPKPLSCCISLATSSGSGDLLLRSQRCSRTPSLPNAPILPKVLRQELAWRPCSDLLNLCSLDASNSNRSHIFLSITIGQEPPMLIKEMTSIFFLVTAFPINPRK